MGGTGRWGEGGVEWEMEMEMGGMCLFVTEWLMDAWSGWGTEGRMQAVKGGEGDRALRALSPRPRTPRRATHTSGESALSPLFTRAQCLQRCPPAPPGGAPRLSLRVGLDMDSRLRPAGPRPRAWPALGARSPALACLPRPNRPPRPPAPPLLPLPLPPPRPHPPPLPRPPQPKPPCAASTTPTTRATRRARRHAWRRRAPTTTPSSPHPLTGRPRCGATLSAPLPPWARPSSFAWTRWRPPPTAGPRASSGTASWTTARPSPTRAASPFMSSSRALAWC